jgi:hypothetical protein
MTPRDRERRKRGRRGDTRRTDRDRLSVFRRPRGEIETVWHASRVAGPAHRRPQDSHKLPERRRRRRTATEVFKREKDECLKVVLKP